MASAWFEQARLVKAAALSAEARTQRFAVIDLAVNLLALGMRLGKRYRQRVEPGPPPGLGSAAAPSVPR